MAFYLGVDVLVYYEYQGRGGWCRYRHSASSNGRGAALMLHCVYSQQYGFYHAEPIVNVPVERYEISNH